MRLIDADALMDELENEQPFNWTDSPGEIQEQADWERFKGMVSVANTIEAEPVRQWISVEDKFPEECLADKDTKVIHCLVVLEPPRSQPNRKPLVTKAQRQWNSWIKRWEWGRVSGVIYWMPLPEPPKEV